MVEGINTGIDAIAIEIPVEQEISPELITEKYEEKQANKKIKT